jgi:phosphatidylserine/phosphatidylglycerophosphate/cardiolipin synthase-like enzyme
MKKTSIHLTAPTLIAILGLLLVTITGCQLPPDNPVADPTAVQTSPYAPTPVSDDNIPPVTLTPPSADIPRMDLTGWLKVYFTNPNPADDLEHGIDQVVLPYIDAAAVSIDVTSFDFNLPSVIEALILASQRGVKVRVVYDSVNGNFILENDVTHNQPFDASQTLKAAGIAMADGGRADGLMHNKFIIIDGKVLFTGSWNLSYNDTYRNNNNLLRITNPKLIANYQARFNELFVNQRFGSHAEVRVPYPSLIINGSRVENYFSPTDQVMFKLIQLVKNAQRSVHFMIFTYTDHDLAAAMVARSRAGVDVQGVIENRGATQGAMVELFCAKIPVQLDGNPYTMHHKVIIIDGKTVITGSFNFTHAADTANDENILIIHNQEVAALFEQEYQRIRAAGQKPDPSDFSCE